LQGRSAVEPSVAICRTEPRPVRTLVVDKLNTVPAIPNTAWRIDARVLLPVLSPGSSIVLDNARAYHSAKTTRLVEKADCRLFFLAAYSPGPQSHRASMGGVQDPTGPTPAHCLPTLFFLSPINAELFLITIACQDAIRNRRQLDKQTAIRHF
jgi:hypothetical protein